MPLHLLDGGAEAGRRVEEPTEQVLQPLGHLPGDDVVGLDRLLGTLEGRLPEFKGEEEDAEAPDLRLRAPVPSMQTHEDERSEGEGRS